MVTLKSSCSVGNCCCPNLAEGKMKNGFRWGNISFNTISSEQLSSPNSRVLDNIIDVWKLGFFLFIFIIVSRFHLLKFSNDRSHLYRFLYTIDGYLWSACNYVNNQMTQFVMCTYPIKELYTHTTASGFKLGN